MKGKQICACLLIVVLLLAGLSGCVKKQKMEQYDWQLYGAWISESGTAGDKISFSYSASLPTEPMTEPEVIISKETLHFPSDFPYSAGSDQQIQVIPLTSENGELCVHVIGFADRKSDSLPMITNYVVYPEQELMVFLWDEGYFVASTDPDADLAKLFEENRDIDKLHQLG